MRHFIAELQAQAYEYFAITSQAALLDNLRRQLEALNKIEVLQNQCPRSEEANSAGQACRVLRAVFHTGAYSLKQTVLVFLWRGH